MRPGNQRGGAAERRRSAALGPVAGGLPARRQPRAGPGPGRNGAVTRAGGRRPRPRPRHRQRPAHIPGRGCRASRQPRPGSSDPDATNDVRVALQHCLAGHALERPARQLTLNSHPGRGTHNRSICRAGQQLRRPPQSTKSAFSAALDPDRTTELTITATDWTYRPANKYASAQRRFSAMQGVYPVRAGETRAGQVAEDM